MDQYAFNSSELMMSNLLKTQLYERLSALMLILALASALGADVFAAWRGLFLALGAISGAGAVALYFGNQWCDWFGTDGWEGKASSEVHISAVPDVTADKKALRSGPQVFLAISNTPSDADTENLVQIFKRYMQEAVRESKPHFVVQNADLALIRAAAHQDQLDPLSIASVARIESMQRSKVKAYVLQDEDDDPIEDRLIKARLLQSVPSNKYVN